MTTHSRFRFPIILLLAIIAALLWSFAGAKDYGRTPLKDNGKRIGKQTPVRRPYTHSNLDEPILSPNTPFQIPDGPGGVIVDSIVITEDIIVTDLDVKVDITHSWVRDLTLILTHVPEEGSPDSVLLLDQFSYGFAEDMTQTWFADEAGYWILEAEPPMTGSFRPMESLAVFNDRNAKGTWYLEFRDRFAVDTGTVNEWALEFNHVNTISGQVLSEANLDPIPRARVTIVDSIETIVDTVETIIDTNFVDDVMIIDTSYVTDTTYVVDFLEDTYTRPDGSFAFPRLTSNTVDFAIIHPYIETKRFDQYIISNDPRPYWLVQTDYLFQRASLPVDSYMTIQDGTDTPITLIGFNRPDNPIEIIDVNLALDITHPYIGDLSINLKTGSDSVLTDLVNFNSNEDGDNLLDCRFDDEAAKTLDDGIPPYTGDWKPTNALSYFDELVSSGNWELTIYDKAELDSGYITRADLMVVCREIGTVAGKVTYGNMRPDPIVGCEVSITGSDATSCTNQLGEYLIEGVSPGEQTLSFNHKVFGTETEYTAEVEAGVIDTVDATLEAKYDSLVIVEALDVEYTIPDAVAGPPVQVTIDTLEIEVGDIGFIADLNVILNIDHIYVSDVVMRLFSPDFADSADLNLFHSTEDLEYGTLNFVNTVFDDQSCGLKWYESGEDTNFTGRWAPEKPLNVFDGINANGTWHLEIYDAEAVGEGILHSWSLEFYIDPEITGAPILDTDDDFEFHGNYPNPFNPSTTFSFDLIRDAQVKLIVYNVLGQQVQTLLDKPLAQGIHQVTFDANTLPSGLYFARLSTPHQSNTRKLILLK